MTSAKGMDGTRRLLTWWECSKARKTFLTLWTSTLRKQLLFLVILMGRSSHQSLLTQPTWLHKVNLCLTTWPALFFLPVLILHPQAAAVVEGVVAVEAVVEEVVVAVVVVKAAA